MKQITILITLLSLGFTSTAQVDVELNIEHRLNNSPFSFNSTSQAPGGYNFTVDRLQYYVSEISIIHDGGTYTSVENTWLLVDAGDDANFELGTFDITNIEGIAFYVGVDRDTNNADPSEHAIGHPLAPQNPSMHWGWQSGYRFVAMEGNAGPNAEYGYEIHALGNENYNRVQVTTSASTSNGVSEITIYANYAEALRNVDISSGLILHATTGGAVQFLNDFADFVFYSEESLNVTESETTSGFEIYPNPSAGSSKVKILSRNFNNHKLVIYGVDGKMVESIPLQSNSDLVDLPELPAGTYSVCIEQGEVKMGIKRLVITP